MKNFFCLVFLTLSSGLSYAFQVDSVLSLEINSSPELIEQGQMKCFRFVLDNAELMVYGEKKSPTLNPICNLAQLKYMYQGTYQALDQRGQVLNSESILIEGLHATKVNGILDLANGMKVNTTQIGFYFNSTLYFINYSFSDLENDKIQQLELDAIIKTIRINNYGGVLKQLDTCEDVNKMENSTAYNIGYLIGTILFYLGVGFGVFALIKKYLI